MEVGQRVLGVLMAVDHRLFALAPLAGHSSRAHVLVALEPDKVNRQRNRVRARRVHLLDSVDQVGKELVSALSSAIKTRKRWLKEEKK